MLVALISIAVLAVLPPAVGRADDAAECPQGLLALTFDDGPQQEVTPALLDVLVDRHAPATFFVLGAHVAALPKITRRASELGFAIGNHTYRHADLTTLPRAAIVRTLHRTHRALVAAGAVSSHLMRPPFGRIDRRVRGVIRSLGLVPVLWTIDPRDWAGGSGTTIAGRVISALQPGSDNVVLLHDGVRNSPNTLAAVPRIIRRARDAGYCLARLGPHGHPVAPPEED
ncbi:MAG TPA: polysaccharide deacetylase family protein [Nocardioidaceae bacterium]|nr:polysaccharide deacetylase family protein [Nocardioidaceae bacterium]